MIETSRVSINKPPADFGVQIGAYHSTESSSFKEIIYDELKRPDSAHARNYDTVTTRIEGGMLSQLERNVFETRSVNSDGKKDTSSVSLKGQFKKYKEDQLLSNPGGDHFDWTKDADVIDCTLVILRKDRQ